jgi:hypothetical protein
MTRLPANKKTVSGVAQLSWRSQAWMRVAGAAAVLVATLPQPVQADTVALPNADQTIGLVSPFGSIPPVVDWNWVDSPFKPIISDTFTYNDNVAGLPSGFPLLPGMASRGDFLDLIQIGDATKVNLSGQQFFFDYNYGVTRYFRDVGFDSIQYSLDAGVNWTFTSRCSGTLKVLRSEMPSVFEQTAGVGVNNAMLQSLTETAKCAVLGDWSVIANSGNVQTTSSLALDQLNGSQNQYLTAGIRYDWTGLDNFQVLYTLTNINYPDRAAALGVLGLAQGVQEKDISTTYQSNFLPKLSGTISVGLTDMNLTETGGGTSGSTQAPHFAVALSWQPTTKLQFTGSISRSVGPPDTLVANAETTTSVQLGGAYAFSPKLSFNAGFRAGQSTATQGVALAAGTPLIVSQNQNFLGANLGVAYQATPFLSGSIGYQYSDRKSLGLDTTENSFIIAIRYAPY